MNNRLGIYLSVVAAVILIFIYFYPQKTGDTRTAEDGTAEVYWRGPAVDTEGKWLKLISVPAGDIEADDKVRVAKTRFLIKIAGKDEAFFLSSGDPALKRINLTKH